MTHGFAHYVQRVRDAIEQGATLAAVEDEIEIWPVSEDERSALWLFACFFRAGDDANQGDDGLRLLRPTRPGAG